MKSELYHYLRRALSRTEPYPVIDHSIRAELNADQSISFYIHPTGIDGETKDFVIKLPGAPAIDRTALQDLLNQKHGDSLAAKPEVAHHTAKCVVFWRRYGRDLDQGKHRKLLGEIPNVRIVGEFKEENRDSEVQAYCYILEPTFPENHWKS